MYAVTRPVVSLLFLLILGLAAPRPAAAQSDVTTSDIQRIQDDVDAASRDIAQLRSRDSGLADQLQSDLDQVRDEVAYLRVKMRKNEAIARRDYTDLRDRVADIGRRARGESTGSASSRRESAGTSGTVASSNDDVPVGTEFDVRLQKSLSSSTAQVEDRFEATTAVDLRKGDRIVVPAGSVMRGVVSSVTKAGRLERKGALTLAFDRITIDGRSYPVRATVTQALESEGIKGEAVKIGAGAGVGAIIGGILGGTKGALAGILIGGGGTIAATEGKDVELPAGTVLRVRMDTPINLER
jgi:hypothetical protein